MEELSTWLRQAFIQLIADQTGLEIKEHDQAALGEKIHQRMKALELNRPEYYYQLLVSHTVESEQEWQAFIVLLTNLESFFFRDQGQFSLLRKQILPQLIQRKQSQKILRLCSAGCSTGEEPYSLAILLKELIPDLEQWNLLILGVDINAVALEKAREGIYRSWSLRGVDQVILQKYFQLEDNQYRLNHEIKQMVSFETASLVKDPVFKPNSKLREMDLIICRNVFIYFETSAIAKVLEKFYKLLQPSGYLLTGHSELHEQNLDQFETKVFPESVIYQRSAKPPIESYGTESYRTPLSSQSTHPYPEDAPVESPDLKLETSFKSKHLKMQQAALALLKQLPANTKIARLNNLTAAELITHLELELNSADLHTP
ncbi:MAG: protein-glutamate O-methyltransferase CheR [Oscillatoriophycideae cyanobacterium NC_groundwater_1537_Pr4_S-0.65um_50_18]|nr:protein-glutamate O-methyltransferase CheR [Oscillatoriophycideae cyanobacterium NC_groundwater_1537_Pr4_S-0.65um_50_18]